ncbi:MAG: AAA family ATPase [Bacillota bacterium]
MYRSFEVRNFRCFRDLAINDLERINLIAGINNVGKTALLEALFLHCGAHNPELTIRLNAFRGIETIKFEIGEWIETPWDSLFADFDVSKKIELVGIDEATGHRSLSLEIVHKAEELVELSPFFHHLPDRSEKLPPSHPKASRFFDSCMRKTK